MLAPRIKLVLMLGIDPILAIVIDICNKLLYINDLHYSLPQQPYPNPKTFVIHYITAKIRFYKR